jgi:hypothetical protein
MAAITAAVGAVAIGVGGAMKAKSAKSAAKKAANASKFNPFNIQGAGGNVTFDGQNITQELSAGQQSFADFFGQRAAELQADPANQRFLDFANQLGNEGIPQAFAGANAASQFVPGQAFQEFGNFAGTNAAFGQAGGMNALAAANQFGQAQTGINEGVAQGLIGQGFGALGQTDFGQVSADMIARQRAFARPGEERAVNAKFQNLFNRGALSSTGGERQIGELALSQELADIQRVNQGEQFGNLLAQQNRQFGLSAIQGGLGARQQDVASNLGRAGLFAGVGQNLLGFGQQAAQQGLQSQIGFSDLINSRAQQRLSNATSLFGFGQQADQQNLNQILQMFGGQQALDQSLREQTALAGNISSQAAQANARRGQFLNQTGTSPLGSFIGGVGQGLVSGFGGMG